jgi:transposase-like protein
MKQQRRFTKEFEDEAVRLVRTSGRTQREIAEDLGVGLSTLVRWLGRSAGSRGGSAWRIDSAGRRGGAAVRAGLD